MVFLTHIQMYLAWVLHGQCGNGKLSGCFVFDSEAVWDTCETCFKGPPRYRRYALFYVVPLVSSVGL
jgi:hypothetical protein